LLAMFMFVVAIPNLLGAQHFLFSQHNSVNYLSFSLHVYV
jgi:hypothetical protein